MVQTQTQTQYYGKRETMEQRVSGLEDKNIVAEQKAEEGRTITVKEVFERVVALEARLDALRNENKEIANRFTVITYIILALLLTNLVISILIYFKLQGVA